MALKKKAKDKLTKKKSDSNDSKKASSSDNKTKEDSDTSSDSNDDVDNDLDDENDTGDVNSNTEDNEGAGKLNTGVKSQASINSKVGQSFDNYVFGKKFSKLDDLGQVSTQESFKVTGLGKKSVRPDYSIYDKQGNLTAIGDVKSSINKIPFDDQAKGFLQVAQKTKSKSIIYYTPLGNTLIDPKLILNARRAGIKIQQIGVK